ncbi:DUF998 domain-containing protein [Saccharomonospora glauca]|jgi:hypothetical protein|uniref:DUF998 domain-containing protein n=1 Tax=Saccharomonospora glauca K62 TaxID=928724 RepID=I1CX14_9PSEU|nr:DUF998 domain-containing protein [Saccharomonospora glauca]EIE97238.1 hypothetical protein SacglDRAFT_00282 [Saccharomonospora glauca K62]
MGQLGTKAASTEDAPARVRAWTFAATASLGWALFTLVVLHIVSSFNPITDPISRYAFTDKGQGMLEASLLSFAVGIVAMRGALLASGLGVSRTATILVFAAAVGLVAAAMFPATFTSEIDPRSGVIHQYASLIAFLSIPGIALCLLDQLRDTDNALRDTRRTLARLVWIAIALLALFGATYLADKVTIGVPPLSTLLLLFDSLPEGLLQRFVFVADFVLLATLLSCANRAVLSRAPR